MKEEKSKKAIIALFTMLLASTLIPTLSPSVLSEGSNPGSSVIVFDQGHIQFYDASLLSDFIAMLRTDGYEVIINNASITKALLDAADILIITDPDTDFTRKEIEAIYDFISGNGSLLVMGTWYKYFESRHLNLITEPYGIQWNDVQVMDETDYDAEKFYPLIHNWTVNAIATAVTQGVTQVKAARSTCLTVSGNAVPIGVGDDDTYAVDETGAHVINGSDVIAFAAVDLPVGGRIFASGGSQMLQDTYYLYRFNNTRFTKNIIGWLEEKARALRIKPATTTIVELSVEYPPELDVLPLRDNATVKATIKNYGNLEATNISATIHLPHVVTNQSKKTVDIGNLAPEQSIQREWKVEGILIGPEKITVEVKSNNTETMSAIVDISVVSDIRILRFDAGVVFAPISNESIVNATIKNIASLVTHDVTLELVLPPSGVTPTQSLTVNLGDLNPYNITRVTWDITVEELGFYDLTLKVSTTDGGNPTAKTLLLAVKERLLVYDNGHGDPYPYIDALKAESFISLMRERGEVYISNSTLSRGLLSVTRLLVIPAPRIVNTHTTAEIEAIKEYVENGGALFLMGTYYGFFDPSWYDPITSDYGIEWVDGSVQDANDHDPYPYDPGYPTGFPYFVLLDTFPDNKVANKLKPGVENIKMSGTALNITVPVNVTVPANGINVTVYPIVTGDDDLGENKTVTVDPELKIIPELNGTNTIPLAAVEITGGGKIVASGSDFLIRSDNYPTPVPYGFFDHNEQFLRNLLAYLLEVEVRPEIRLTLDYLTSAYINEDVTVSVTVKNRGTASATVVEVEISPSAGLSLLNNSATFDVGTLGIGQEASLMYLVRASEAGDYTVTVTVTFWNGTGFEEVTETGPKISVSEKPGIPLIVYIAIAVVVIVVVAAVAYLIIRRKSSA